MTLAIGDKVPPFSLPATGGKTVSPASLEGRKAVIYFYPKDDTSGCTKEAIDFTALKNAFAAAGTEVVGVSADSVKSHENSRTSTISASPSRPTRGAASSTRWGCGSRRACTAAPTWASSGRRS